MIDGRMNIIVEHIITDAGGVTLKKYSIQIGAISERKVSNVGHAAGDRDAY